MLARSLASHVSWALPFLHDTMEQRAQERIAAIRTETDKLTRLLESNTELTRQDKELTEHVADLTKQIHAALTKG